MTDKYVLLPDIPSQFHYPSDLNLNTKPAKYNTKKGLGNFTSKPSVYIPVSNENIDLAEKNKLLVYKDIHDIGPKTFEAIDKGKTEKNKIPDIENELIKTGNLENQIKSKKRKQVISTPSIYPIQDKKIPGELPKIKKSRIKVIKS